MKNILTFVLGAAAGSLITWKLVEEKYKRLAEKEIEEVREYYKGKKEDEEYTTLTVKQDYAFPAVTDEDINAVMDIPSDAYAEILSDMGYTDEEVDDMINDPDITIEKNEEGGYEVFIEPPSKVAPYVISPEEYGDLSDYDTESWTLYADGILTNDDDQIVDEDEIGYFIGDALKHFGKYEDDSVHVRNENTGIKCDIEILKHSKTYDDVHGGESHADDIR